jgi:peptidyl-prolyl cis-trans isomerase SurA
MALMAVNAQAQDPEIIDKVIAVVGERVVLYSDIEEQIDQMTMSEIPVTENSRCEVLEDQMYQKLFVERAIEDSITVGDDMVEQELDRRLRYFIAQIGSEEELIKFYGKTIDEIKEDFRDEVKDLLLIQQMQQHVVGDVKVSPAEVREFFADIPEDSVPYINSEVMLAQLVRMPPVSEEEKTAIKNKLNGFKDRVAAGEEFGTLAYLYSQDPGSALKNGELGFMDRTELVSEFSSAAMGLQKGEVSEIVETQFGYHIIQMIDRKGDRLNVRHILIIPQVSASDLQNAKVYLDSLKNVIETNDTLTFERMAIAFSDDKDTRMNGGIMINPQDATNKFDFEVLGKMDRQLLFNVEKKEVGDLIGPDLYQTQDGKRAYRVVKIVEMTEPHVANLRDDYHRIQEGAKRKKENIELETWIQKHRNSAYVWVSDEFNSCPFKTKWVMAQR